MIQAKCIQKFRDNQNKIYGYRLVDINGQTQDVTSDNLKQAIRQKQISIVNLTLTSDNRLVDTNEKQLQSPKLGSAPQINNSVQFAKAMTFVDESLMDMGDNYEEVVENLCFYAGIEINETLDCNKLEKFSIKAYTELLNKNKLSIIEGSLSFAFANDDACFFEMLINATITDNDCKTDNIRETKIYRAIQTIYSVVKGRNFSEQIKTQIKDKINLLESLQFKALQYGYYIGHNYYKFLDSNVFGTISNSYFTVGDIENINGKYFYIFRKSFNLADSKLNGMGFAVFFNEDQDKNVTVRIKNMTQDKNNIQYGKTKCAFSIRSKNDLWTTSKKIADKLNELAKELTVKAN